MFHWWWDKLSETVVTSTEQGIVGDRLFWSSGQLIGFQQLQRLLFNLLALFFCSGHLQSL